MTCGVFPLISALGTHLKNRKMGAHRRGDNKFVTRFYIFICTSNTSGWPYEKLEGHVSAVLENSRNKKNDNTKLGEPSIFHTSRVASF